MILEAKLERVDSTTAVFHLSGRMTLGMRLREMEAKINDVADQSIEKLILDLSAIEFIDSAGLGALMIIYGKVRGGQLRVVVPGPKVLEVLNLTHTDSILQVDPDVASAIAS